MGQVAGGRAADSIPQEPLIQKAMGGLVRSRPLKAEILHRLGENADQLAVRFQRCWL